MDPEMDGKVAQLESGLTLEQQRLEKLWDAYEQQEKDLNASLDQINILEELKEVEIKNLAFPILFLPFLSRASEIIGKKIYVKIDDKKILLNLNVNISSNFIDQEFPKIAKIIEVSLLENEDNFTDDEWNNLYRLSEETFVEESDSLKKGAAGAGLTDND